MEDRAGKDPDLGSCLNLLGKLEEEERERVSQHLNWYPYKCFKL